MIINSSRKKKWRTSFWRCLFMLRYVFVASNQRLHAVLLTITIHVVMDSRMSYIASD